MTNAEKKGGSFVPLAQAYKQINAPVGQLGVASACVSTVALQSGSPADDSTYTNLENQLILDTAQRVALASQMIALLDGAEFNGQLIPKQQASKLIAEAQALLNEVSSLASCQ